MNQNEMPEVLYYTPKTGIGPKATWDAKFRAWEKRRGFQSYDFATGNSALFQKGSPEATKRKLSRMEKKTIECYNHLKEATHGMDTFTAKNLIGRYGSENAVGKILRSGYGNGWIAPVGKDPSGFTIYKWEK